MREKDGGNALAGFGSAKGSNEEAYLVQKLVRTGFGTNNVDIVPAYVMRHQYRLLWRQLVQVQLRRHSLRQKPRSDYRNWSNQRLTILWPPHLLKML